MEKNEGYYCHQKLESFITEVLVKVKLPLSDARLVAKSLIQSNLEGLDSHGISRLPPYYQRIREGKINPKPQIQVDKKSRGVVLVNGDNGIGQVVATRAVDEGIVVAKEHGVAAVGVNNSNHFGTASFYCQRACKEGLVSIVFTNSPPGIAPWGGSKAFFGTNPIAFGFPTGTEIPVIIDLSSSVVARGRVMEAAKRGEAIPEGWAIDAEGNPTTDAGKALQGSMLPVGGAKGYALAYAIEVLSGVLSGAAYGPYVQADQNNANVGHFFIFLDAKSFMPEDYFYQRIQQMIDEVKSSPLAEGNDKILIPGERRFREFKKKVQDGISIPKEVINDLKRISDELNIPF